MTNGPLLAQRYKLITRLGSGGMGSVWLARDMTLNAEIAIKLIDPQYMGSDETVRRFRREAQAAAAIRSTHVIQILDYGIDKGTPYIAMERLTGESLARRLLCVGALAPQQTGRILGQVASALALAHRSGIVHRDIKPDNIFLVRDQDEEICKVLDFGIAQHREDSEGLKTRAGTILGTPFYMSPEQATGQNVDHRTDIWSFGVVALECLTAKRAFNDGSLPAIFHAICEAPLPVPSHLAPVPVGFDEWFARAVAREKSSRFQSIAEAAAELLDICTRMAARSRSVSRTVESEHSSDVGLPAAETVSVGSAIFPGFQYTAPSIRRRLSLKKTRRQIAVFILLPIVVVIVAIGLVRESWPPPSYQAAGNLPTVESVTIEDYVAPPLLTTASLEAIRRAITNVAHDDGVASSRRIATAPSEQVSKLRVPSTPEGRARRIPASSKPIISRHPRDDNAAGI